MKNTIYSILLFFTVLNSMRCADFTEIEPKGKNTLNTLEDLDLVLNYTYGFPVSEIMDLVNDKYPTRKNIQDILTQEPRTLDYVHLTWDPSVDRAILTETDAKYTELYAMIGQVANPVLLNIDAAKGDKMIARQLKAEALVLRGWCHYIAVNLYAKAYRPETAKIDPGIVYARETDNISIPNEKLTVAKVYDCILSDIDSAIHMKSLPVTPDDMRIGLPFAYAAKAKVLMSMRDYKGAFDAATESLKLCCTIENYNDKLEMDARLGSGLMEFTHFDLTCEEELFASPSLFYFEALSSEMWNAFEEGHVFANYVLTDERMYGNTKDGQRYYGIDIPFIRTQSLYYNPLGLTTVDMYLTQAECYIREGNTKTAMEILNKVRENRVLRDVYVAKTVSSTEEAMVILKNISRTDNFATPKNFINLKRWNTEETWQETIRRTIKCDKEVYKFSLTPDSPLWIFPFPQNATAYNPNLTQNY